MTGEISFLKLEAFNDIERLIENGVEENLNLDYKASPALARDSKAVDELCKDVSAFANSAGGQLVYGVAEDKKTRKPTDTDPGITDPKITREWIEQVINSKIQQRISGIRTVQIDNRKGGSIFVVTIPPTQVGPHQASDKRYYKRFDLQSVAMEDYEIRDILNRSVNPQLYVVPSLGGATEHKLEFKSHQDQSEAIHWQMKIGNRSKTPAEYAQVVLGLDPDFQVATMVGYKNTVKATHNGLDYKTYTAQWSILEKRFPIFQEAEARMSEQIALSVHQKFISSTLFRVFIAIQAPGFSSIERFNIQCQGGLLRLLGPVLDEYRG